MKVCTVCGIEKHINMFGNDKSRKDGKRERCKDCISIINKERWKNKTKDKRSFDLEPNVHINDEYHVTRDGKVINRRLSKELKPTVRKGYECIALSDGNNGFKNTFVHRLVALAYIENKENKEFVNHIDGNKRNNDVSNLEWVTASENTVHAINTGLITFKSGKEHHLYGKQARHKMVSVVCVIDEDNEIEFKSIREAVNKGYATTPSKVSACINGERNKHNGYKWRRK